MKAVGGTHKFEPFNVEKEHKIINPHWVEKETEHHGKFKGHKVQPKPPKQPDFPVQTPPFPIKTTNQEKY